MVPELPPPVRLALASALFLGFFLFDLQAGVVRGLLLLALTAVIWGIRPITSDDPPPPLAARRVRALQLLCASCLTFQTALGISSVVWTARNQDIRLDQGQNSYRAARLLQRGDNPYASRAILDLVAFHDRASLREAAGYPPRPGSRAVERYWQALSTETRDRILPLPPAPSAAARREAQLLGYKYGPADAIAALVFVVPFGQAGIPLLNLSCFLAYAAAVCLLLREVPGPPTGRWVAMAFVLADPHAAMSCLWLSATDIRVLLPLVVALRAFLRRQPRTLGWCLAVALATKLIPGAVFLPLLFAARARTAWIAFATGTAILQLPFLMWDAGGFVHNLLLWGAFRGSDSTSWIHEAPGWSVFAARIVLAAAAAVLAARLAGFGPADRRFVFRDLALLHLVVMLAAGMFHNNYLPWITFLVAGAAAAAWRPATGSCADQSFGLARSS